MLDQALKIIQEASDYLYSATARKFDKAPTLEVNESPPRKTRRIPLLCHDYYGKAPLAPLARHLASAPNERSNAVILQGWDDIGKALVQRDNAAAIEAAHDVFPHINWAGSSIETAVRFLYVAGLTNGTFEFVERGVMLRLGKFEIGMNHLSIFLSMGRTRWTGGEQSYRQILTEPFGHACAATPLATAMIDMAALVTPQYSKQAEHLASAIDLIGPEAVDAFLNVGWNVVDAYKRPVTAASTIWDQARAIVVAATFDPTDELRALLAGTVSERDLEVGLGGAGDPTSRYHAKRRARHLNWLRLKSSNQRRSRPAPVEEIPASAQKYLQLQEMLR